MKKKLLTVAAVVAFGFSTASLFMDAEVSASCEITKGDKVIFSCTGDEGTCDAKKFGYELNCSGKAVDLTKEQSEVGLE